MPIIITALSYILGETIAKKLLDNLMIVGIAAAVLVISNGVTGLVFYVKGHNAAAAQCKVNTLIRERDELKRDLGVAQTTSADLKNKLDASDKRMAELTQKEALYAATIPPIQGCTVPARPAPAGRVRKRLGQ